MAEGRRPQERREERRCWKASPSNRGTTPRVEGATRALRRRLTPAEHTLWDALRRRQLEGLRFRCPHPVDPFVLDFSCPAVKLAIEVDGEVHRGQAEQDEHHTRHLEACGYRVLRVRNDEILSKLPSVLVRIVAASPRQKQERKGSTPLRSVYRSASRSVERQKRSIIAACSPSVINRGWLKSWISTPRVRMPTTREPRRVISRISPCRVSTLYI